MSQSLVHNAIHLVFSTKKRHPWLRDVERDEMHAYIGGILNNHESPLIEINSVSDHVHVLYSQSKNIALAKLIEHVKTHSSVWLGEKHPWYAKFHWQRGYGAFGVSATHVERMRGYLRKQKEHHEVVSFQDEFRRLCRKNNVPLDERYAWD